MTLEQQNYKSDVIICERVANNELKIKDMKGFKLYHDLVNFISYAKFNKKLYEILNQDGASFIVLNAN